MISQRNTTRWGSQAKICNELCDKGQHMMQGNALTQSHHSTYVILSQCGGGGENETFLNEKSEIVRIVILGCQ